MEEASLVAVHPVAEQHIDTTNICLIKEAIRMSMAERTECDVDISSHEMTVKNVISQERPKEVPETHNALAPTMAFLQPLSLSQAASSSAFQPLSLSQAASSRAFQMSSEKIYPKEPMETDFGLDNDARRLSSRKRTPSAKLIEFSSMPSEMKKTPSSEIMDTNIPDGVTSPNAAGNFENAKECSGRKKSLPRTWTPETMALAIEAVTEKRLTIRKASYIFNIPKSTLSDRISGKCQIGLKADKGNHKWQFNEDNLRKMCKVNVGQKCDEVIGALKGGAINIKDAAKDIGISGWKLYKYLKNEMEVSESVQTEHETFMQDHLEQQIVKDLSTSNDKVEQLGDNYNEEDMEESEEEEEIEDYDSEEVEYDGNENMGNVREGNIELEKTWNKTDTIEQIVKFNIKKESETIKSTLSAKKQAISHLMSTNIGKSSIKGELSNKGESSNKAESSVTPPKRRCKQWTEELMQEAIRTVKENNLPVRKIALQFGIPKSSLQDRISGKVDKIGKSPGRSPKPRVFKQGAIERLCNKQTDRERDWVFKALTEGTISVKEASRQYGVSYYTLKDCLLGPNDKKEDEILKDDENKPQEDGTTPIKKRRVRHKWSIFDMKRALASVKEENMSIRSAAKKFNIPKSTLADVVTGKCVIGKSPGPKKFLSDEEEQYLAGWLVTMHKIGKEVSRQEVLDTVKTMLDKEGRKLPKIDDNKPKEGWWYGFLRRHHEVADLRKSKKEKGTETSEEEKKSKEEKKKEREVKQQEKEERKLAKRRKTLEKKVQKLAEQIIIEQGREAAENMQFNGSLFESKKQRLEDSVNEGEGFCVACGGSYSGTDSNQVWICCGAIDAEGNLVDGCGGWFHVRCTDLSQCNLTPEELQIITWHCQACTAVACIQNDINM